MSDDDPRAGWLPDAVQRLANAAVRAGLVPFVDEALYWPGDSVEIRGRGDRFLGLLAQVGPTPFLYLDEIDPRTEDCARLRGFDAISEWLRAAGDLDACAVDAMPTPR
jgi:hypothetical protein